MEEKEGLKFPVALNFVSRPRRQVKGAAGLYIWIFFRSELMPTNYWVKLNLYEPVFTPVGIAYQSHSLIAIERRK